MANPIVYLLVDYQVDDEVYILDHGPYDLSFYGACTYFRVRVGPRGLRTGNYRGEYYLP